jgi:hypothetical protein
MSGMSSQVNLKAALGRLVEMQPQEASPAAEARLLSAFRARKSRSYRRRVFWATLAACLALGLGWFWSRRASPLSPAVEAHDKYSAATAGFIALPYAQSGVPLEETVIVRVNLQPSELGSLGMPVPLAHTNGRISADLLVGQDGVARAVRLVE